MGTRVADADGVIIGTTGATDEFLEWIDSIEEVIIGAGPVAKFLNAFEVGVVDIIRGLKLTYSCFDGVGVIDDGFELTCVFTIGIDTIDNGVGLTCVFTNGVDIVDGGVELIFPVNSEFEAVGANVRLICPVTSGVDAADDDLEFVCSLTTESETINGACRLICPFTGGVEAADDGLEFVGLLTSEFDGADVEFKLIAFLTEEIDDLEDDDDEDDDSELVRPSLGNVVSTIDENFELTWFVAGGVGIFGGSFELLTVSGLGAGAIDGFLVATNSEINDAGGGGAAGTFDG